MAAIDVTLFVFAALRSHLGLALVGTVLAWLGGLYLFHGWGGGKQETTGGFAVEVQAATPKRHP